MKGYLQILSTGTTDCSPSVLIQLDNHKYMINCGEGTQRLCMQSKAKFSKLKAIMLTRTHWDAMGGLPGMLLTASDTGIREMTVLGGENLTHAIASTRHFVYRDQSTLNTVEFGKDAGMTFNDELLRVTAVQIYPDNFVRAEPYTWSNTNLSLDEFGNPVSATANNGEGRPEATEPAALLGSKRGSEEMQDSEVDPMSIRKNIISRMFCWDKNAPPPSPAPSAGSANAKKPRINRNSNVTAGKTDVDIIEGAEMGTPKQHTTGADGCSRPATNSRFMELPRTSPNTSATCYILQTPDYPGKFSKVAAEALNIKPLKLYSQLVKGNTVVTESGDTIHPHQVLSGSRPGRVFMVIDCPSVDYISQLVQAKEFEKFQTATTDPSSKPDQQAACIIHFGGHDILSRPEYKAWMKRFGSETQHIVANGDYCSEKLIWQNQAQSSYKLSLLDSSIFPIPYYDGQPAHTLEKDCSDSLLKIQPAQSMLNFDLEPSLGLNVMDVISPLEIYKDHKHLEENSKEYLREYWKLAKQARDEIAKDTTIQTKNIPGKEVVLTTLGTGSSHPSKYRNVSASLIDVPGKNTFLLDVGEGTYGQMFRQFGGFRRTAKQANSVDDKIERLGGIFISHMHADHHLGTVRVIDAWNKQRKKKTTPLVLIGPRRMNAFLQEFSDVQDFGYQHVKFIDCDNIVCWRDERDYRKFTSQTIMDSFLKKSGFEQVETVDVIHCFHAYGISMTHKDGWKIVYSGDTRPSQNLVNAGEGATVLLHEATFEDDMRDFAIAKKHSMTKEAIMVGEGMDAMFTMLTHFSQRYPKIPRFNASKTRTTVGICFDLMSVKFGQMPMLPKFLPALEVLYSPESEEAMDGEEESKNSEIKTNRSTVPGERTQRISQEVFRISSDVSSIQRLVGFLGTNKDTEDMRSKLHDLTEETRKRVKSTSEQIKELAAMDTAVRKLEYQKLSKDFQKVIVEFQKAQRLSAEKQREFVDRARHASIVDNYEDEDRSESGDRPLLQDSQRRMQLMVMDNELEYNQSMILQREEEIRGIESGISELNEVFRDLSTMVNDQGGMLDSIENNVTSISMTTHAASEELTTAAVHQRKARKKACYLMLIVAIVTAVVILAILS
ncbi:Zinc phosphodiesterase ELAC protein 2 [Lunasporangiospora selenospora]|uniref:ribonuclease Z n=1 Tax=Lunasporangiospora selenospora TaxID=979761 RepID=A0A9P6KHR1_9FUNG|nr:Zinc phosphodiesterase ELAC protein 2 [Lunasporangiospora selenospora]